MACWVIRHGITPVWNFRRFSDPNRTVIEAMEWKERVFHKSSQARGSAISTFLKTKTDTKGCSRYHKVQGVKIQRRNVNAQIILKTDHFLTTTLVENTSSPFFSFLSWCQIIPAQVACITTDFYRFFRLDVLPVVVSPLWSLFGIILQTSGAVTRHSTWGGSICYSSLSFYFSPWSTIDVPFVCIYFWLSRSCNFWWTWSSVNNVVFS